MVDFELRIDDPKTYVAPWTLRMTLTQQPGYEIYEYGCHEGNRAVPNSLSGERAYEKAGRRERREGAAAARARVREGQRGRSRAVGFLALGRPRAMSMRSLWAPSERMRFEEGPHLTGCINATAVRTGQRIDQPCAARPDVTPSKNRIEFSRSSFGATRVLREGHVGGEPGFEGKRVAAIPLAPTPRSTPVAQSTARW